MPSFGRIIAYALFATPAAIGVWFVARFAYVTSDTAIDGASNAFLFGMIAVGAYAGPAAALIVASNGRKGAAGILWLLAILAMVTNWSQTLGAVASRGAGTEAERVKAVNDIKDDRARLARLDSERGAMRFAATDAAAVQAAQAAVTAAEASRQRECGNGEPKQHGPNCRTRETEEAARRETLTTALANKALTDQAGKLESEAALIRARLKTAQPVKEGNSLGEALGRLLPMSATTAATAQQGLISAIAELLIAAALALPELLRQRPTATARDDEQAAAPPSVPAAPIEQRSPLLTSEPPEAPPPKPAEPASADTVGRFMLACLSKAPDDEAAGSTIYARYQRWCDERQHIALHAKPFAIQLAERCQRLGIRTRREGSKVYFIGVRLAA